MNFATCTADSQQFYRAVTDTGLIVLCPVPETAQLDYEGESAVIIGTGGRRIPEADTLTHSAALTLCNEGTLRDWARHAKFNVTQGNNWDGSCPILSTVPAGWFIQPRVEAPAQSDFHADRTVAGAPDKGWIGSA